MSCPLSMLQFDPLLLTSLPHVLPDYAAMAGDCRGCLKSVSITRCIVIAYRLMELQMICGVQELSSHDWRRVVIKLCTWLYSLINSFSKPNPLKAKWNIWRT